MERAQHPSNNAVLGAPPGVPIERCSALPITRVEFEDGGAGCVSFWRPSPRELVLMTLGHSVRLCVLGHIHPPIALGVDGDGEML